MIHQPVLVPEVLEIFRPHAGDTLLDATIGHGGHAKAYLQSAPNTRVVGFDADAAAIAQAKENLAEFKDRVKFINQNFSELVNFTPVRRTGGPALYNHILFDLGVGDHQLADSQRGFSFRSPGTLNMSYGPVDENVPQLLGRLGERDLADLIRTLGEERFAGRIARAIKANLPVDSAKQLADIVARAVPAGYERGRIHPATRTFQALRIAVNSELDVLRLALPQAVDLLAPNGIIAVISFHSLEDRIVKHFFREQKDALEILTKKPVPGQHSSKLRAAKKKQTSNDTKHPTTRHSPPQKASL